MSTETKPKQLTHHLVTVEYYHPNHGYDSRMTYQVADIEESRRCGREIAFWLSRGVGYEVRSTTTEIKRGV
jgi:hypothetical protein